MPQPAFRKLELWHRADPMEELINKQQTPHIKGKASVPNENPVRKQSPKQVNAAQKQPNSSSTANRKNEASKRQRIRLPFEKRKSDIGEWAYDHRVGLCVTVILYLIAGILFISAKIMINKRPPQSYIMVEVLPEPIAEIKPEEQQLQQAHADDFSDVRNRTSNENASESTNDRQTPDRLTDELAEELAGDQREIEGKLRANRESFEKSLSEEQAIRDGKKKENDQTTDQQDVKVKGKVTVSFSFKNPVRTSRYLHVPAYRCMGGGEVTVIVTLNRNGNVTSASIDKTQSNGDDCMFEEAIAAAKRSRFNIDASAPAKHEGTISYIFIPQ